MPRAGKSENHSQVQPISQMKKSSQGGITPNPGWIIFMRSGPYPCAYFSAARRAVMAANWARVALSRGASSLLPMPRMMPLPTAQVMGSVA